MPGLHQAPLQLTSRLNKRTTCSLGTLARKAGLERRLKEPLLRMSSSPELRGSELPAELPRVAGNSSVVLGLGRAG